MYTIIRYEGNILFLPESMDYGNLYIEAEILGKNISEEKIIELLTARDQTPEGKFFDLNDELEVIYKYKTNYYKIENGKFVGFYLEKEGTIEEQEQFYEISQEEHEALMKGQAEGKTIVYEDGKLVLVELEETLTKEQLLEQKINYILEYSKLEENMKVIEASKFSTEYEIRAITEKLEILEGNIEALTEKLKAL